MAIVAARNTAVLSQAKDPKAALLAAVGDLSDYDLFHNQILVAIFVRPEKTAGGIIRPGTNVQEDEYQGKVGLVVKVGPTAFVSEDEDWMGQNVNIGDWVIFKVGDGWALNINNTACRILTDRTIRIRYRGTRPEEIY